MVVPNTGQPQLDLGQWGRRVRDLRKSAGWSLRELEARSGVGKTTINSIERGQQPYPGLDVLLKLQSALGLDSIEALLGELPSARFVAPTRDTPRTS